MFVKLRFILLGLLVIVTSACHDGSHYSPMLLQNDLLTESGQIIPAGAYAVAIIDSPQEATLLMLRGMVGTGKVLLRQPHGCEQMSIRFVAGDFGGSGITVHKHPPVQLAIRNARAAQRLVDNQELVSEDYRIGQGNNDAMADIAILSGLQISHGFVLNPGKSFIADLFGTSMKPIACSTIASGAAVL